MAKLTLSAITSLDGCVADPDGNFDCAVPDEELQAFTNDLERQDCTYLYGRRMYEGDGRVGDRLHRARRPPVMRDFAEICRAAEQIVRSKTPETPSSARARIEREFDPASVRRMKTTAERDITVGGPHLAAQAIKAGLVDECHLFRRARRGFGVGVVHLRYRVR